MAEVTVLSVLVWHLMLTPSPEMKMPIMAPPLFITKIRGGSNSAVFRAASTSPSGIS
jgi:hypothetical protein